MSQYFIKTIFLLTVLSFLSCNKNDDTVVEEIPESRFEQFLGDWEVVLTVSDGVESTNSLKTMTIVDNDFPNDNHANGTYSNNGIDSQPMTIELHQAENQIIFRKGILTQECTYKFLDENRVEIDDSIGDDLFVNTWKRLN